MASHSFSGPGSSSGAGSSAVPVLTFNRPANPRHNSSLSTLSEALQKLEKMPGLTAGSRPGTSLGFSRDRDTSDTEGGQTNRPKSVLGHNGKAKAKDDSHAGQNGIGAARKRIGQAGSGAQSKANRLRRASTVGPSDLGSGGDIGTGANGTGTGRPSNPPQVAKPSTSASTARPSGSSIGLGPRPPTTTASKPIASAASANKSIIPNARPISAIGSGPLFNKPKTSTLAAFGFQRRTAGHGGGGPKASKRTTLPTVIGSPVKGGADAVGQDFGDTGGPGPKLGPAFGALLESGAGSSGQNGSGTGHGGGGIDAKGETAMDVDSSNVAPTLFKGKGKLKSFQDPELHDDAPPSSFKLPTSSRMQLDRTGDVFFNDEEEETTGEPGTPEYNPHAAWRRNASRRASMAREMLSQSLTDRPEQHGIAFKDYRSAGGPSGENGVGADEATTGAATDTQAHALPTTTTETPPPAPTHGRHLRSSSTSIPSKKQSTIMAALSNGRPQGRSAPGGLGKASGSGAHVSAGGAVRRAASQAPERSAGRSGSGTGAGGEFSSLLKGCVIYVDVRTDEGDDGGELCREFLEAMGAKVRRLIIWHPNTVLLWVLSPSPVADFVVVLCATSLSLVASWFIV